MPDDKLKRGGQDRSRINVSQPYELRDWADKFGVSPEDIRAAVEAVGDRASAVEQYFTADARQRDSRDGQHS